MTAAPGRTPEEVRRALAEQIGSGQLRPGQWPGAERALLTALAESLAGRGLPRCAALVAEAAEIYARRGLSA